MQVKDELKNTFTSYWEYLTLQAACKIHIFDLIENGQNSFSLILKQTKANRLVLEKLLFALVDLNTIQFNNDLIILTQKGKLLTENHAESMKNACILWGNEHLTSWQNLTYTIQTGKPAFDNYYGNSFFNYIKEDKDKLKNYHLAMAEYARDDYRNIIKKIDFSNFNSITDIGGGMGILLQFIKEVYPQKKCTLFELPEVIDLIEKNKYPLEYIEGDFLKSITIKSDALVLSRILHDWNDEKSSKILSNCYDALSNNGTLFIIEIMQDEINANLLSLNMLLMTDSYERTYTQYDEILLNNRFKIVDRIQLNDLQTILIAKKNEL